MSILNGVHDKKKEDTLCFPFLEQMPCTIPIDQRVAVINRINRMNEAQPLFYRKNRIMQAVAIMEEQIKEIEDEIEQI